MTFLINLLKIAKILNDSSNPLMKNSGVLQYIF